MDSSATTQQRPTHNDNEQLEELDIDSILRRSRHLGRTRRRKPMFEGIMIDLRKCIIRGYIWCGSCESFCVSCVFIW